MRKRPKTKIKEDRELGAGRIFQVSFQAAILVGILLHTFILCVELETARLNLLLIRPIVIILEAKKAAALEKGKKIQMRIKFFDQFLWRS